MAAIPDGKYTITSVRYPNVVVHLNFGSQFGTVILYNLRTGYKRQQWQLTNESGNTTITLESVSTPNTFVRVYGEVYGAGLSGSPESYYWALKPVTPGGDKYYITTADGSHAWYVEYGDKNTPIALAAIDSNLGEDAQWTFTAV